MDGWSSEEDYDLLALRAHGIDAGMSVRVCVWLSMWMWMRIHLPVPVETKNVNQLMTLPNQLSLSRENLDTLKKADLERIRDMYKDGRAGRESVKMAAVNFLTSVDRTFLDMHYNVIASTM